MENKLRFSNICIEGPDCSGKTTLYNKIHKSTKFKYNIQDRSYLSMYIHSKFYGREDASFWYEKLFDELKKLDTLYVLVVPKKSVLIRRINKRGDEFQDAKSVVIVRDMFYDIGKFRLSKLPNVVFSELEDTDLVCEEVLEKINILNTTNSADLIKGFVVNSNENEVVDIQCKEIIDKSNINYKVLNFDQEKEYYKKILKTFITSIEKTLYDENEDEQTHSSRRFVYTDNSCISMIHILFRNNRLNVSATLRSSNILTTLWADYEFLKIVACRAAEVLELEDYPIMLSVNIRSAHKVP